ncbi:MAG: peptidylprolyl isomerase [Candidatus Poseidoniaceae archaeon]|nr:peptidylprolyl isomerase [Candidatus Poseidoniaceae archaeon]MBL6890394.1 peptidylprolyl isomerase [Candidatus Poseidoniaceae archaeon]
MRQGGLHRTSFVLIAMFLMMPSITSAQEEPDWRSNGIDPSTWEDGPVVEDTPMQYSYYNDPVFSIEVTYAPGHFEDEVSGTIIIELFPQWAPITVENMVEHVEDGLYDGIFFHRVINDFVTQSGDPECTTVGAYPITNLNCGSGGTGETIPLEHDENLSHVDGAIGMARGTEEDSADSQWYIAETEAHGLDPENRDDGGYATFGIVRQGMSHVRAIAEVPTSDDATGTDLDNPFSSAGRPVYEVKINKIEMIGVADPDGKLSGQGMDGDDSGSVSNGLLILILLGIAVAIGGVTMFVLNQKGDSTELTVYDAELLDENETSSTT